MKKVSKPKKKVLKSHFFDGSVKKHFQNTRMSVCTKCHVLVTKMPLTSTDVLVEFGSDPPPILKMLIEFPRG